MPARRADFVPEQGKPPLVASFGAAGPPKLMRWTGDDRLLTRRQLFILNTCNIAASVGLLLIGLAAIRLDLLGAALNTAMRVSGAGFLLLLSAVPRLYLVERVIDTLAVETNVDATDQLGSLGVLHGLVDGALLTCVCLLHVRAFYGAAGYTPLEIGACLALPCLGLHFFVSLLTLLRLREVRANMLGRRGGVGRGFEVIPAPEASPEP